jgi:hypothetical protein
VEVVCGEGVKRIFPKWGLTRILWMANGAMSQNLDMEHSVVELPHSSQRGLEWATRPTPLRALEDHTSISEVPYTALPTNPYKV